MSVYEDFRHLSPAAAMELMLLMLFVGAMNLVWMAGLAAEKIARTQTLPRIVGLALLAAGAVIFAQNTPRAALGLGKKRIIRRSQAVEPWKLEGELVLYCNCTIFCPCVLSLGNAPPTEGYCRPWAGIRIVSRADKSRMRGFGRNWNFAGRSAEICRLDWGN